MSEVFDSWWEQAKFQFIDDTPSLDTCGNCGKHIVSRWAFKKEVLLLHSDKTMCSKLVKNV